MGLLTRTNAKATPRSVIRWALIGGAIGLAFAQIMLFRFPTDPSHRAVIIAFAIVGACTGALVEWQHDDEQEEGCEEGEECCD